MAGVDHATRQGRDSQFSAPISTIRSWVRAVSAISFSASGRAPRGEQLLGGRDHRGHDQVGQHPEVLGGPAVGAGEPGEVGGQLALAQLDLVADRLAHRQRPGGALAGDEQEVRALLPHVPEQGLDRAVDDAAERGCGAGAAYVAEHGAQGHERLVDQRQAERLDRVEVPVERGRHDADLLGHLAQRDRGQAAVLAEREGGVEDRATGALLALHPRLGPARRSPPPSYRCTCVHAHAANRLTVTTPVRHRFSVRTYTQSSRLPEGGTRWVSPAAFRHHPPLQGGGRADVPAGRRPLPRAGQPDVGRPRGPGPHRRRPPRGRRPRPPAGRHDHAPADLDLAGPPRRPARPARRRDRRRPPYDAGLHDLQPRLAATATGSRSPCAPTPTASSRSTSSSAPRPARWSTSARRRASSSCRTRCPSTSCSSPAAPASPR